MPLPHVLNASLVDSGLVTQQQLQLLTSGSATNSNKLKYELLSAASWSGPRAAGAAGPKLEIAGHRSIGAIRVKGSSKLMGIVEVYQADPLPLKQHKARTRLEFERAVALRRQGALAEARRLFESVAASAKEHRVEDAVVTLKLSHDEIVEEFIVK